MNILNYYKEHVVQAISLSFEIVFDQQSITSISSNRYNRIYKNKQYVIDIKSYFPIFFNVNEYYKIHFNNNVFVKFIYNSSYKTTIGSICSYTIISNKLEYWKKGDNNEYIKILY